jgi:hypothetical protein
LPEIFPPLPGSGQRPYGGRFTRVCFFHLTVMPNRRIDRMTVTWFQVSPPSGVLMPGEAAALLKAARTSSSVQVGVPGFLLEGIARHHVSFRSASCPGDSGRLGKACYVIVT